MAPKFVPSWLALQFEKPKCEHYPGVLIPLGEAQRHHSAIEKAESDAKTDPEKNASPSKKGKGDEAPTEHRESLAAYDVHTIEGLKAEAEDESTSFGRGTQYDRKAKILNKAIQDIGMGPYQWKLFILCGFGWFADNFWLQGIALTLPQLTLEFGVSESRVRFTTMSLFIGLCIGASVWGIASDVIGRRLAFNTTLFIGATFGLCIGSSPTWIGVCAMAACLGTGVGGNLPVDGALFLEFLPFASGNLLTLLSIWWPVGSLVASLIAWGLIPNFSCVSPTCPETNNAPGCNVCTTEMNYGWRYFIFTLGGITFLQWFCRFVLFHMFESPKFLLSSGRQEEAVAVIHGLAYKNKKKTWLTVEILNEVGGYPTAEDNTKLGVADIIKRSLSKFSTQRIAPLFYNWKLGLTCCLLWFQWCTIGMGYPLFNAFLPQYLGASSTSVDDTYRNYAITTIVGVPGSAIAYYTVNLKYLGRKGTMAISTCITGVFIFLFTASKDPKFQLAFSSLEGFFQNVMYGVLYAYTPEVFPAPNRGTGTGISSFLNRIGGFCAPIVAIYAGQANPTAPIYASGGLLLAAFISMIFLPLETRGKQTL